MVNDEQRVALVTGATSGIGLAVTKTLASHGTRVFICARTADDVAWTVKDLREQGFEVDGSPCDVRSRDDAKGFVQAAVERFGPVGILVNNAGRGGGGPTAQ